MLTIQRFMCNPLQENCYVVSDDSRECVIIDCGAFYPEEYEAIDSYLTKARLHPVCLLATHGHLDHNFGNARIYERYGLQVAIGAEDQSLVEHLPEQASTLFGIQIDDRQPPVGRLLHDGDTITFGNHSLVVLHTPGHSHGSCIFHCPEEHVAFTGDTLFRMSIGRTDFPEGSWSLMEQSLRRIADTLSPETVIHAGHGPQSTIAEELRYNPYLRH